jgi:hypothetical protein
VSHVTIHRSSHVSKAIEVITSIERRRRWSAAEKERLELQCRSILELAAVVPLG